jgi:hypothetical protein
LWHIRTLLLGFLTIIASGCSTSSDTFRVDDPEGLVTSATVAVCDAETAMTRNGDHFAATHEITCEGSGLIRLKYADGKTRECIVGYVTSMRQDWHFRATPDGCEPKRT